MKKADVNEMYEDTKTKLRPMLLPTSTLLLALGCAYYYGKNKGQTYVVMTPTDEDTPAVAINPKR